MTTKQAHCCAPASPANMERTRFFARQLVTPDDLTQDQIYFRDKARRHNRMLHGWGVACGAEVKEAADGNRAALPWKLAIEPGYILGPYGDEILIDHCVQLDIRTTGVEGSELDCIDDPPDPWCSDVRVDRAADRTLYVAVRYSECPTRPVRSQGAGCGCSDNPCEYSRIRDGYVIAVLDTLPGSHDPMPPIDGLATLLGCTMDKEKGRIVPRPCPPCPEEPWVVLADVKPDANGKLAIDNFAHRRFVISFGALYTQCVHQGTGNPSFAILEKIKPAEVENMMAAFTAAGRPAADGGEAAGKAGLDEAVKAALRSMEEARGSTDDPLAEVKNAVMRVLRERGEKPGE
jgi:hypothetical protein